MEVEVDGTTCLVFGSGWKPPAWSFGPPVRPTSGPADFGHPRRVAWSVAWTFMTHWDVSVTWKVMVEGKTTEGRCERGDILEHQGESRVCTGKMGPVFTFMFVSKSAYKVV